METYGGGGVALPFFNRALGGGEWLALRPCRLTPGERALCTHWIGGWVYPKLGKDDVEKRKSLAPTRNQTPAF
jgi:hypothetical protein